MDTNNQPQQQSPQAPMGGSPASQYNPQELSGLAQQLMQQLGPQGLAQLLTLLQHMIGRMGAAGGGMAQGQ